MHTGSFFFTRPSIGAWLSYGLGTMNQNLPSFIVISPHTPYAGGQVWGNDFLPAYHQGTRVVPGAEPIPNLQRRTQQAGLQELELDLAEALNKKHLAANGNDSDLAARIRSFETAFHMQAAAPEAFDIAQESDETLELYGLKRGDTRELRLAVPGGPPAGRAGRAVHRADRPRGQQQLGRPQRHDAARAAGQGDRPADRGAA